MEILKYAHQNGCPWDDIMVCWNVKCKLILEPNAASNATQILDYRGTFQNGQNPMY